MVITFDSALEAYTRRMMPDYLREGSAPPATWREGPEAWELARELATAHFRRLAAFEFMRAIADRGFTVEELVTGEMQRGAEVGVFSGNVHRPSASEVEPEAVQQAQRLRREVTQLGVTLDGIMSADLDSIANGRLDAKRAAVVLRQVAAAVNAEKEARRSAVEQAATKPLLVVRQSFRAKGRSWPAGEHFISDEEAEALEDWRRKMEAQARLRGWGAPDGFKPGSWPPFQLKRQ